MNGTLEAVNGGIHSDNICGSGSRFFVLNVIRCEEQCNTIV